MDKTYLDFFNYYLQQFLNELISYFPSTKRGILDNYRSLLEGRDMKNDCYVKFFMTKCNDCLAEISKKDVKLFEREQVVLIEGVNFHEVWTCPESNDQNRMAIWKFLQLLVLLGRRVIPNTQEIVDMLKRVGGTIDTPTPTDLKKAEGDDTEDKEGATAGISNILNMASSLGNIGNLVGGLAGGAGGEGLANLGNLASTITEGLKNFNLEDMMKQMSSAMPPTSTTGDASSGTANCPEGDQGPAGEPGLFNGGLFADLAKDVASTFEIPKPDEGSAGSGQEGQTPGQIPDMSKAFQNFMTGDNPAKMMNLIGKYGARLQQDIANGKMNPMSLLQQATQMMGGASAAGGVPNIAEMAKAMGADQAALNRMKNATRGDATKDRLRAKLEAKKANQN
jgi:hypothetical protein